MTQSSRITSRAESGQGLVYSSPTIHERRRRILEETRRMVAEHGLAGFSMDELGKRAGVAKRTLYNAYQTKERMIAIAIHEYFERYIDRIPYTSPVGSIQRNIERITFVIERDRQIANYVGAIMWIYFSPDSDDDIRDTMHAMAVKPNRQWIDALAKKRQLQPWINPETFADDIVRCEYAIINDWCLGRIEDDKITTHLVMSCLTLIAGATRGAARKEVEAMLHKFQKSGVPIPTLSLKRAKKEE